MIGVEQRFHPNYSNVEKAYIRLLGVPVVGLRIRTRNLLDLIPREIEPTQVLDIGSGPGVITFQLARRFPNANVVGVDLLQEQVQCCRQIAETAGLTNTEFQLGNACTLPWTDRFDLVTCVDIMEHIEQDDDALSSIQSAVRPGGMLVLHVPALYRRFPVFRKTVNFDVPTHVRPGYEPNQIEDKVRRAGFDVVDCGFTFGFLETLANNLGYLISRGRKANKPLYGVAFPVLNLVSWLGRCSRPKDLGAGVFVIARKPDLDQSNGERGRS
jgi:SAM-dependent methyltransferase